MKRVVWLLLLVVVGTISVMTGCRKPGGGVPKERIRIAVVGPLTGSQAAFGKSLVNGAQLAVDEANAKGGVRGAQIDLVQMDDKADPKEAVSVANKLVVDQDVVGVVGHFNSGCAIPASPVYHSGGLAMVTPDVTNPKLTEQGFDNVFRVCTTDKVQGTTAAEFVTKRLGKKRLAAIHDKTAYGQGIAGYFKSGAEAARADVVAFEGISEGDRDFTAILTRLKGLKPEAIFFGGMVPEAGPMIRQARQLGVDAIFAMGDGCFDEELMKVAGNAAEGCIVTFLAPPWEGTPEAKAFVKQYTAKYGELKPFAPLAYEATNVILEAVRQAKATDRNAVKKALHEPGFVFHGLLGETKFDDKGDAKGRRPYVYHVVAGKFVEYK